MKIIAPKIGVGVMDGGQIAPHSSSSDWRKIVALTVNYPDVCITPEAKNKLDFYIEIAPNEISGFGVVKQDGDQFIIEDVYIFNQESSAASTEISPESLATGLLELIEAGIDPNDVRLWWHSHANMSASFSSIDDSTMDKTFSTADWFISIVGNKRGEFCVRLDLHSPVRVFIDEIPLKIQTPFVADKKRVCKAVFCNEEAVDKTKYCEPHIEKYVVLKSEFDEKVQLPERITVYAGKEWYGKHVSMACAISTCDNTFDPTYAAKKDERYCWTHRNNKKDDDDIRLPGYRYDSHDDEWVFDGEDSPNFRDWCDVPTCGDEKWDEKSRFCEFHDYVAESVKEKELKGVDFDDETLFKLLELYDDVNDVEVSFTEIDEAYVESISKKKEKESEVDVDS